MTLITSIALLAALQTPPLRLVAETSKPVYAPGEQVVVSLKLLNTGRKEAVAALGFSPVYPSASIQSRLLDSSGKELFASSNLHEGQWMVGELIRKKDFAPIAPGKSAEVSYEKFKQIWPERRPRLKSEYEFLKPAGLAPGTYRLEYSYAFEHLLVQQGKDRWAIKTSPNPGASIMDRRRFEEGAKPLYDRAFTGKLKTTVTFQVKE